MSGLRVSATAAAVVSFFIISLMLPLASVDAAPRKEGREADMKFLEYLGTFEANGEVMDPLIFEQMETDKNKKEKPVKKKQRAGGEERKSEKDAGNE